MRKRVQEMCVEFGCISARTPWASFGDDDGGRRFHCKCLEQVARQAHQHHVLKLPLGNRTIVHALQEALVYPFVHWLWQNHDTVIVLKELLKAPNLRRFADSDVPLDGNHNRERYRHTTWLFGTRQGQKPATGTPSARATEI